MRGCAALSEKSSAHQRSTHGRLPAAALYSANRKSQTSAQSLIRRFAPPSPRKASGLSGENEHESSCCRRRYRNTRRFRDFFIEFLLSRLRKSRRGPQGVFETTQARNDANLKRRAATPDDRSRAKGRNEVKDPP